MEKQITFIIILTIFCLSSLSAQSFQKANRLGLSLFPQSNNSNAIGTDINHNKGWKIPPIFFENERRLLKYFTLGSETTIAWYKFSMDDVQLQTNIINLNFEIQAKASIPLINCIEAYAQYGIGYNAQYVNNNSDFGVQEYYIGSISNTIAIGGSFFISEGFALFTEIGVLSIRSIKTAEEIIGVEKNSMPQNSGANQSIKGKSPYLKLGLCFAIN